jgi:AAA domain
MSTMLERKRHPANAVAIFDYWKVSHDKAHALLDDKRAKLIADRLQENDGDVSELLHAIDGALEDDFFRDHGIDTLLKDRGTIERLVEKVRDADVDAPHPALPPLSEQSSDDAILERLGVRTMTEMLRDPHALDLPLTLIPHLMWKGRATLLAGKEKLSGKSTVVGAGIASFTSGRAFLGVPCEPGRLLIFTEEHPSDLLRRLVRFGADGDRVSVMQFASQPVYDLLAAQRAARADAVVVDTMGRWGRPSLTAAWDATQWGALLDPLIMAAREDNFGLLLTSHVNVVDGRYQGGAGIGGVMDQIITVESDKVDATRRTFTCVGRWPEAAFAVRLVDDAYVLEGGEVVPPSPEQRIVAFARSHLEEKGKGCSQRSIRSHMRGMRTKDVDALVAKLLNAGVLANLGTDARFELAPSGSRVVPAMKPQRPAPEELGTTVMPVGTMSEPLGTVVGNHSGECGSPAVFLEEHSGNHTPPDDLLDDDINETPEAYFSRARSHA